MLSPHLPVVRGDRPRLRELLQNLIENAIKFSCHQEHVRIEIGSRRDDDEVVLYVRDNGIGIDPQHHERIFGLFDKLDPSAAGTGVGLALVKQIVATHGGRIWVESEGRAAGACFCFTLPIAESSPCREDEHHTPSMADHIVA
jgi:signal transduction histidine kinase